ncbi:putative Kinesin heavy chain [Blattamonas nauphoetae]|uniref:Kinesin heavy chain n=1 Tax=Blattamonas nauphoetae TaxID=2049346 RepID=A0ABQ9Y1T4_9EUKA|nr:putative Kinesin heavy chain [Blattamonas nauphoetae]
MSQSCSVRVICRFRPVNKREKEEEARTGPSQTFSLNFPDEQTVKVAEKTLGSYTFPLDRVFPPGTDQPTVYNDCGRQTIEDILQGFNGTLFAYGQTGAGKSFTMFGADVPGQDLRGIIPRSSIHIFNHIENDKEETEFTVVCSFLEIYMEKICDLLDVKKKDLPVRESPKQGIYVEGLTEVNANSVNDIDELLAQGERARHASFTQMNATSSRSHSVFIIKLQQKTKEGTIKSGKLNLVDLAGSEKVGKTGASGDTLEEAKKINQSLSALGNCIHALTEGKGHIPFRDSKLTRVLQESLEGNTKTTMIVACSPHPFNCEETVSTLRFAQRAKTIKLKVKANTQKSAEELQAMLTLLQKEIKDLKTRRDHLKKELEWMESDTYKPGDKCPFGETDLSKPMPQATAKSEANNNVEISPETSHPNVAANPTDSEADISMNTSHPNESKDIVVGNAEPVTLPVLSTQIAWPDVTDRANLENEFNEKMDKLKELVGDDIGSGPFLLDTFETILDRSWRVAERKKALGSESEPLGTTHPIAIPPLPFFLDVVLQPFLTSSSSATPHFELTENGSVSSNPELCYVLSRLFNIPQLAPPATDSLSILPLFVPSLQLSSLAQQSGVLAKLQAMKNTVLQSLDAFITKLTGSIESGEAILNQLDKDDSAKIEKLIEEGLEMSEQWNVETRKTLKLEETRTEIRGMVRKMEEMKLQLEAEINTLREDVKEQEEAETYLAQEEADLSRELEEEERKKNEAQTQKKDLADVTLKKRQLVLFDIESLLNDKKQTIDSIQMAEQELVEQIASEETAIQALEEELAELKELHTALKQGQDSLRVKFEGQTGAESGLTSFEGDVRVLYAWLSTRLLVTENLIRSRQQNRKQRRFEKRRGENEENRKLAIKSMFEDWVDVGLLGEQGAVEEESGITKTEMETVESLKRTIQKIKLEFESDIDYVTKLESEKMKELRENKEKERVETASALEGLDADSANENGSLAVSSNMEGETEVAEALKELEAMEQKNIAESIFITNEFRMQQQLLKDEAAKSTEADAVHLESKTEKTELSKLEVIKEWFLHEMKTTLLSEKDSDWKSERLAELKDELLSKLNDVNEEENELWEQERVSVEEETAKLQQEVQNKVQELHEMEEAIASEYDFVLEKDEKDGSEVDVLDDVVSVMDLLIEKETEQMATVHETLKKETVTRIEEAVERERSELERKEKEEEMTLLMKREGRRQEQISLTQEVNDKEEKIEAQQKVSQFVMDVATREGERDAALQKTMEAEMNKLRLIVKQKKEAIAEQKQKDEEKKTRETEVNNNMRDLTIRVEVEKTQLAMLRQEWDLSCSDVAVKEDEHSQLVSEQAKLQRAIRALREDIENSKQYFEMKRSEQSFQSSLSAVNKARFRSTILKTSEKSRVRSTFSSLFHSHPEQHLDTQQIVNSSAFVSNPALGRIHQKEEEALTVTMNPLKRNQKRS